MCDVLTTNAQCKFEAVLVYPSKHFRFGPPTFVAKKIVSSTNIHSYFIWKCLPHNKMAWNINFFKDYFFTDYSHSVDQKFVRFLSLSDSILISIIMISDHITFSFADCDCSQHISIHTSILFSFYLPQPLKIILRCMCVG
jgi:hypothetical protein